MAETSGQPDSGEKSMLVAKDEQPEAPSFVATSVLEADWPLLDAGPDGLVLCDITGSVLFVNHQLEVLTGYRREELIGRPVEVFVPDAMRVHHEGFRRAYQRDPDVRPMGAARDLSIRCKDGSQFAVEIRLAPVVAHGVVVTMASVRDVTERLAWSRRLRASEEAFRVAFEQAPVAMAVTALEGGDRRVIRANQVFADMLGVRVDDLVGRSPAGFTHPDDDLLDQAATARQLTGVRPSYVLRKRYRRADGTYLWGELHTSVLEAADGHVVRLSHIIDITGRVAEEERTSRVELLRKAVADVTATLFVGRTLDTLYGLMTTQLVELIEADDAAVVVRARPSDNFSVACQREQLGDILCGDERAGNLRLDDLLDQPGVTKFDSVGVNDPGGGPRLVVALKTTGIASALVGVARSRYGRPFSGLEIELFDEYVSQIGATFEQASARNAEHLQELLHDRERIARDLHDTVIQDLFAAGMRVSSSLALVPDDDLRGRLSSVVDEIDSAIRRLRNAIFDLNVKGAVVATTTVSEQVHATVREAARILGHKPLVTFSGAVDEIPSAIVTELIPTLREALSNVARHAHASATSIKLSHHDAGVQLVVEDDGVGITVAVSTGNGTINMKERAALLGGICTLASRPTKGTRCEWLVPDPTESPPQT